MEKLTYIAEIVKAASERRAFSVDYTDRMPAGATLVSCAVSASNRFTGTTDNTILSSTTATIAGAVASVSILGGTAGQSYDVAFAATLSDGSIIVDYVSTSVRNIRG